jgi:DNA-binding CsgD family transcriptional regulator
VVEQDGAVRRLRRLTATLADGRGGSVLIEGEPGIGKSTVLTAGLAEAPRQGCLVLRGAPDRTDRRLTLRPAAARADEAEPLRLTGTAGGAVAAVEGLCAQRPVVLVADDLHRADPAALVVWHRLSRAAPRLPLLLVGAARQTAPDGAGHRLRRALSGEGAAVLRLEPLTAAEVAVMAAALLGAPPGARLRRRLAAAGGNPAYVRELIKSLKDGRGVLVEGRVAEATASAAEADALAPELVAAVCERLGPLPPRDLELLRLASLLGVEFTGRELAALSRREPHELLSGLDGAIAAGVLAESGPRLRFRYELVRLALYQSVPGEQRPGLHRVAAEALHGAGASVDRVAEQLLAADALAEGWAAGWLTAQADELTFRAPELAAGLLDRAQRDAARLGDPDDPVRVLFEEKYAAAMYLLGANDCAPAALSLLEHEGDPARRAGWAFMSGIALNRDGKYAEGLAAVDQGAAALESAAALPPGVAETWSARFAGLRCQLLWSVRRLDEAGELARRAQEEGERLGDPQALFYGTHIQSLLLAGAGDIPAALARMELGLAALGERWQLADQRLLLMMNQAVALGRMDRVEEAHAVLSRAQEVAERCGVVRRLAAIVFNGSSLLFFNGRWDEALAQAGPMIGRPEARRHQALLSALRMMIFVHRGQLDRARADLPAVDGEHKRIDGRFQLYPMLAAGLLADAEGRAGDAMEILSRSLVEGAAWDSDERHWCLPFLARLALAAGDGATAREAMAAADRDAERDSTNRRRRASALRCHGLIDRDLQALTEAMDYYRTGAMPLLSANCREDAAVVAAQSGNPEAARRHLDAAADGYRALGAAWDIARADARLREYGVRRARRVAGARPESGWAALTPAEQRVAGLVAEGHSNPGIAQQLYLSPRTVQTHVSRILAKLGVHSRSEIAREVARRAVTDGAMLDSWDPEAAHG